MVHITMNESFTANIKLELLQYNKLKKKRQKCLRAHNSLTIKIDVTENGLHHSFIKLLQSLQTDTLTVSTQDEKLSQCYIPKERGQPNFLLHYHRNITENKQKKLRLTS